ncbi:MAG: class I tRNA ligase family protein, partial [Bacteroidetes bacterium]|nr:class I tRNA ligase family protein [Bacteroidota bacterium]
MTFIAVSAGLAKKWFEMGWNASQDVKNYVEATLKEQSVRDFKEKEKTGIFAGFNAINPANKEEIPVWITNYVLSDIGTGAIMAVPAHDERDFDFAKKYDLPIRFVIAKPAIEIAKGEIEKRDGSVSIVENEKGEIIVLQNSANMDHFLFPQGGIENNESALECAIREVREESGFNDISLVSELGCDENYFEMRNGLTRHRITYSYHFKLNSNSNSGQDLDEAESEFIVHWMSPKEAINKVNVRNHKIFLERYLGINSICFPNEGILTNSNEFNGLTSEEAKKKIVEFVGGEMTKTYKLRDWGISRQRYWGTPIPVVYDLNGKAHPVPEEHLPWTLPTDVDHTPDGTAPLARSKELFERTEKIFGKGWKPEVETMDTFVDSSWYFYRYLDNKNDQEFASKEKMKAWMPIDLYMGGAEHTTMHLLYSRFWVKALNDLGLVKENEAYKIRRNRGLILAPDGQKMSKSKGNAISPDEIVDRLGADTVRMYLAFMGPYGVTTNYPWDPNGVVGVRRFLERVWKLTAKIDVDKKTCRTDNIVQKTIKGVGEDMEDFKFNTAIAKMMTLINEFEKEEKIVLSSYKILLKLLAPFAPHISEELWQELGEKESIHLSSWPIYDTSLVVDEEVTIGV